RHPLVENVERGVAQSVVAENATEAPHQTRRDLLEHRALLGLDELPGFILIPRGGRCDVMAAAPFDVE
ncbi:MAG TPA: hypothetical protein VFB22_01780, partial [Candidatus Baltobacteraceae bacterium]|nr:hypothetical protein [Candidatus Baltobacteraceae bacterium]